MATTAKSLTLETTALEVGTAAAEAAGMSLSAYASRALRKLAMADNLARAAAALAALPAEEHAAKDALRRDRAARIATQDRAA